MQSRPQDRCPGHLRGEALSDRYVCRRQVRRGSGPAQISVCSQAICLPERRYRPFYCRVTDFRKSSARVAENIL